MSSSIFKVRQEARSIALNSDIDPLKIIKLLGKVDQNELDQSALTVNIM
jgi:hypothetical protein